MTTEPIELLVIDDSLADQETIRRLLSSLPNSQYRIREAFSAADGVRAIADGVPDCVLLDVGLPDRDGIHLLKEFAEAEAINCPFVLMSGSNDPELAARAFGHGAQDFLSKDDLSAVVLDQTIQHALARFRTLREQHVEMRTVADRENMLRIAQDAAGIGTFAWDLETGATRFGGSYFALYGLPATHHPLSYDYWLSLLHPDDRERIKAQTEYAIANLTEFTYEYRVIWPDGTPRWLQARGAATDKGGTARVTGINIDITAVKTTEGALVAANSELQEFAFMAGHDLQGPLRTVSVFSELLERTFASHPDLRIRQAIKEVLSGSEQMRTLIDDLLQFAQSGSEGDQVVYTEPLQYAVDLGIASLHGDVTTTGAQITSEGLEPVHSFNKDLVHVFQNLIGNAMKYTLPGTAPQIHISCTARSDDWLIGVRDRGMGFEMTHLRTIFLPFKRLVSQEIPGTGLGLPICRRLVERNGGHIWAESAPGEGSTFFFTLPFSQNTPPLRTRA